MRAIVRHRFASKLVVSFLCVCLVRSWFSPHEMKSYHFSSPKEARIKVIAPHRFTSKMVVFLLRGLALLQVSLSLVGSWWQHFNSPRGALMNLILRHRLASKMVVSSCVLSICCRLACLFLEPHVHQLVWKHWISTPQREHVNTDYTIPVRICLLQVGWSLFGSSCSPHVMTSQRGPDESDCTT